MARQIYAATREGERKAKKKALAKILSVTPRTVHEWLSRIDKDSKEARKRRIFDLWLACHTQEEIAAAVDLPRQTVTEQLKVLPNLEDLPKSARSAAEHATDFEPPIYNVWKQQVKTEGAGHFGNSDVRWLDNIDKQLEEERQDKMRCMWLACHTQKEIEDTVGLPQQTVSDFLQEIPKPDNCPKSAQSAISHESDFDHHKIYDVWNFPKATNEVSHPGNVPPEIVDTAVTALAATRHIDCIAHRPAWSRSSDPHSGYIHYGRPRHAAVA